MNKIFIIILTCLAFTSLALADYHYASHEGSDEYPYTSWETAADSIQKAIDASSPHDTVYIGTGDWYQYMATEEYDSLAIIGMGVDSTFCNNDLEHETIFEVDYGCSVIGISFYSPDGAGIYARVYAGVEIKDCRFDNSSHGIVAAGYPTLIENCTFNNCGKAIVDYVWIGNFKISNNLILNCYDGWAIMLQVDSAVVENNIIINQPGAVVTGIDGVPDYYSIIRNNVVSNGINGITYVNVQNNNSVINMYSLAFSGVDQEARFFNNSATDCGTGVVVYSDCQINYNNFWGNSTNIYNSGHDIDSTGNIFCDPMHISEGDLHLQAFSPLIDAGDPDILDVDGTRSDIGAYGGPYGESYEYQDLAPAVPESLSAEFVSDTIFIDWRFNTEADFNQYLLHRDTISGFEPSVFNQIAEPETSFYIDTEIDRQHNYYYLIAAVDNQANMSDYSDELEVIPTGVWGQSGAPLPQISEIRTNYPNPFNSSTIIIYTVANLGPVPAEIEINIYDIIGRKVRTLVKERRDIGEHKVVWDGCDDQGHDCAAGVYFARISQWGLEISGEPRKLVIVK